MEFANIGPGLIILWLQWRRLQSLVQPEARLPEGWRVWFLFIISTNCLASVSCYHRGMKKLILLSLVLLVSSSAFAKTHHRHHRHRAHHSYHQAQ
jgi:hypothetical protein